MTAPLLSQIALTDQQFYFDSVAEVFDRRFARGIVSLAESVARIEQMLSRALAQRLRTFIVDQDTLSHFDRSPLSLFAAPDRHNFAARAGVETHVLDPLARPAKRCIRENPFIDWPVISGAERQTGPWRFAAFWNCHVRLPKLYL